MLYDSMSEEFLLKASYFAIIIITMPRLLNKHEMLWSD